MVDVVVMNHDADVLDAMAMVVESAGFTVATRRVQDAPVEQLAAFIREQDPRVVVYDLGPPPLESAVEKWRELCRHEGTDRPYVITTTYPCTLDPTPRIVESVLIKPTGFDELSESVRRAMER